MFIRSLELFLFINFERLVRDFGGYGFLVGMFFTFIFVIFGNF